MTNTITETTNTTEAISTTQEQKQEQEILSHRPLFTCITTPGSLFPMLQQHAASVCTFKRTSLPVLLCISLQLTKRNELTLYSTNLEVGLHTTLALTTPDWDEQEEERKLHGVPHIVIPFKSFLEQMNTLYANKSLRHEPLTLQQQHVEGVGMSLHVTIGKETSTLPLSFDPKDYPSFPYLMQNQLNMREEKNKEEKQLHESDLTMMELPLEAIHQIHALVRPSACLDDSRPVLTAILLHPTMLFSQTSLNEQRIDAVAVDGFRLAHVQYAALRQSETVFHGDTPLTFNGWLLPASTLDVLVKALPKVTKKRKYQGMVRFISKRWNVTDTILMEYYEQSIAEIQAWGDTARPLFTMASRLIEGTYSTFERIKPKPEEAKFSLTLPVDRMIHVCKKLAPITRNSSNIMRIRIEFGSDENCPRFIEKVTIRAEAEDVGKEEINLTEEISVLILKPAGNYPSDGEPLDFIFNITYLLSVAESLKSVECSEMQMLFTDPMHPGLFRPSPLIGLATTSFDGRVNVEHVIMPMSTR